MYIIATTEEIFGRADCCINVYTDKEQAISDIVDNYGSCEKLAAQRLFVEAEQNASKKYETADAKMWIGRTLITCKYVSI